MSIIMNALGSIARPLSAWGTGSFVERVLRGTFQDINARTSFRHTFVTSSRSSPLPTSVSGSNLDRVALFSPRGLGSWWSLAGQAAFKHGAMQHQQQRGLLMQPRRTKFRKAFKGLGFGGAAKGNTHQLSQGLYGIRAITGGRIPANVLEAFRRVVRRKVRKNAMMWICVSPNIPVSQKPAEIRMGKGKGAVQFYAARIQPGQILFEFDNVSRSLAVQAMQALQPKTGLKLGFVEWN